MFVSFLKNEILDTGFYENCYYDRRTLKNFPVFSVDVAIQFPKKILIAFSNQRSKEQTKHDLPVQ